MRPYETVRYGTEPDQFGQLWPPAGTGRVPARAVVLLHGGYWRHRYRLDLMEPLAADLSARGYAVWNLEYRRIGTPGGGWPNLFRDVAAGLDALTGVAGHGLDPSGVAVVGHSAGGHLALWACAARGRSGPGRTAPTFAVSLAGVCDLVEAARQRLSHGAVLELLGGEPAEVPDRYREACPTLLLPLGVRQLVVHGTEDGDVPFEFGPRYVTAARAAGDECELLALPGVEHFALIDPASAAWAAVAARLDDWRYGRPTAPVAIRTRSR